MGQAKEMVKGTPTPKKKDKKKASKTEKNLLDQLSSMMDDTSQVIQIKEADALSEGKSEEAENIRKAAMMRAAYDLLAAAKRLMEGY